MLFANYFACLLEPWLLTPSPLIKFAPCVSRSGIFCQTKHGLPKWQPKLGLAEDSKKNWLGLFAPILIGMTSFRQIWTYLTDWLTLSERSPSELRGLRLGSLLHTCQYLYQPLSMVRVICWLSTHLTIYVNILLWRIYVAKVKVIQHVNFYHSCPQLAILITMSTNNPSWMSVVSESSVKPSLSCQARHALT